MSRQTGVRIRSWVAIVKILVDGRATRKELRLRTGFSHEYVVDIVNELLAQNLIHCCDLDKDVIGRRRVEVFTFGPDPNPTRAVGPHRQRKPPQPPKTVWRNGLTFLPEAPQKTKRRPLVFIPKAVSEVAAAD